MRIWSNSIISALAVRYCAECPEHSRITKRVLTTSGSWVTQTVRIRCRRTGRQFAALSGIDVNCPLPVDKGENNG